MPPEKKKGRARPPFTVSDLLPVRRDFAFVLDEDRTIELDCIQDIPIGHKVALKDMAVGDTVIKYGVDIGKVVKPIRKGEHAHVHNIKTKRW